MVSVGGACPQSRRGLAGLLVCVRRRNRRDGRPGGTAAGKSREERHGDGRPIETAGPPGSTDLVRRLRSRTRSAGSGERGGQGHVCCSAHGRALGDRRGGMTSARTRSASARDEPPVRNDHDIRAGLPPGQQTRLDSRAARTADPPRQQACPGHQCPCPFGQQACPDGLRSGRPGAAGPDGLRSGAGLGQGVTPASGWACDLWTALAPAAGVAPETSPALEQPQANPSPGAESEALPAHATEINSRH